MRERVFLSQMKLIFFLREPEMPFVNTLKLSQISSKFYILNIIRKRKTEKENNDDYGGVTTCLLPLYPRSISISDPAVWV